MARGEVDCVYARKKGNPTSSFKAGTICELTWDRTYPKKCAACPNRKPKPKRRPLKEHPMLYKPAPKTVTDPSERRWWRRLGIQERRKDAR